MNKELYSLLSEYKNKELDKKFIMNSFETMMNNYKTLNDYINNIKITYFKDNLGTYTFKNKTINIDIDNIINASHNVNHENTKLLALETLRHEIEHANSYKKLIEGRNDLETYIISLSLFDFAIKHNLKNYPDINVFDQMNLCYKNILKKEMYYIDPVERIANIKALKFIVNLIKQPNYTHDLLVARSKLYYTYANGYTDNRYYLDPPIYTYLLKLKLFYEYNQLVEKIANNEYSLDTRLMYGLPISYFEYNQEILKKVKLRKIKK